MTMSEVVNWMQRRMALVWILLVFTSVFLVGCYRVPSAIGTQPPADTGQAELSGKKDRAVVGQPVVDLGDGPNSSGGSHTVTQARMGDVLTVLDERSGWYHVMMHDGYTGWVDDGDIRLYDEEGLKAYFDGNVALVSDKTAPVRETASEGGQPLFSVDLVQGSVLPVFGAEGDWTRLTLPDGGEGFILTAQITPFPSKEKVFSEKKGAEGIISTAMQYVGLPYLWGGTTAYGFDCSGFTQFCYRMNGYEIRRDADMQYEQGEIVEDIKDLLPGDLVFFETYAKGPSHVGIYLGDSKYIQSGGSTGVAVLSFDPAHEDYSAALRDAYLGGRRFIK